jgi:outer membrane lipopolysaccharide assembly protein LptE/RlpB
MKKRKEVILKTNRRVAFKKAAVSVLWILAAFLFLLSACGYHFANRNPELGPDFKTIAIPIFANDTSESTLEKVFTKSFRDEFILNSNLSLVSERQADLVLKGRVQAMSTSVVSYREPEESIESRVRISILVNCENAKNGQIVWQSSMSYYQEYFQNPDPIITSQNRQKAIEFVARYLAEQVHQRLAARF